MRRDPCVSSILRRKQSTFQAASMRFLHDLQLTNKLVDLGINTTDLHVLILITEKSWSCSRKDRINLIKNRLITDNCSKGIGLKNYEIVQSHYRKFIVTTELSSAIFLCRNSRRDCANIIKCMVRVIKIKNLSSKTFQAAVRNQGPKSFVATPRNVLSLRQVVFQPRAKLAPSQGTLKLIISVENSLRITVV